MRGRVFSKFSGGYFYELVVNFRTPFFAANSVFAQPLIMHFYLQHKTNLNQF